MDHETISKHFDERDCFIGGQVEISGEHGEWCGEIKTIDFKLVRKAQYTRVIVHCEWTLEFRGCQWKERRHSRASWLILKPLLQNLTRFTIDIDHSEGASFGSNEQIASVFSTTKGETVTFRQKNHHQNRNAPEA